MAAVGPPAIRAHQRRTVPVGNKGLVVGKKIEGQLIPIILFQPELGLGASPPCPNGQTITIVLGRLHHHRGWGVRVVPIMADIAGGELQLPHPHPTGRTVDS